MSKVFVSYKRVDKDKVFPLVEKLEKELGINCWVDLTGIESDEQFSNVIVKAINQCEVFLFMYSKSHGNINPKKDWTVREITFADRKGKRIVFIDVDNYELPDWFAFRFPDQQVIKANDSRAIGKLADDIRKWLRLPQPKLSPSNYGKTTEKVIIPMGNSSHHQTEKTAADKPHPQAIDLGLPSGTKWASCNVGATKSWEYGSYYAWGETEEIKISDEETYVNKVGPLIKSFRDLRGDISGTKYDVAHMKWGGNWKMPTVEDFKELLENCVDEWTVINGVKGRKFTSKINGNSIFLPAAGDCLNTHLTNAGYAGYYWSSTQHLSFWGSAYRLNFSSGGAYWGYTDRSMGSAIRPTFRI